MRTRHKKAIHNQMKKLFNAATALEDMITEDDIRWALGQIMKSDYTNKSVDEVALLIVNLSHNCKEMSETFNF